MTLCSEPRCVETFLWPLKHNLFWQNLSSRLRWSFQRVPRIHAHPKRFRWSLYVSQVGGSVWELRDVGGKERRILRVWARKLLVGLSALNEATSPLLDRQCLRVRSSSLQDEGTHVVMELDSTLDLGSWWIRLVTFRVKFSSRLVDEGALGCDEHVSALAANVDPVTGGRIVDMLVISSTQHRQAFVSRDGAQFGPRPRRCGEEREALVLVSLVTKREEGLETEPPEVDANSIVERGNHGATHVTDFHTGEFIGVTALHNAGLWVATTI
ncbi:hypothetical protein BDN72DRAFT_860407 [Pluteus cervinus]|uniref:Uncharacterized protein n=1 Tax=Pluteus cervinus TaxID=181527 RepID=A0ACD3AJ97_9AGAR|nr:hypothetical protein BDN72DRAFT_860407 [Pluteus cervinus]